MHNNSTNELAACDQFVCHDRFKQCALKVERGKKCNMKRVSTTCDTIELLLKSR